MSVFGFIKRIVSGKATVKKLRKYGAIIGDDVEFYDVTCSSIDATCLEIGNHVTLTGVTILTHDASTKRFLGNGFNRVGRVVIGSNVFIGKQTLILPNVRIGNNVIVGAGSIVTKNIPDNVVAAGNPAKIKCDILSFIEKHRNAMKNEELVYWNFNRNKMDYNTRKKFNDSIDGKIVYLGRK